MKRILPFLIITFLSCNMPERPQVFVPANTDTVDRNVAIYLQAARLVDSADRYVEMGDTKAMSVKKANERINPLMKQVDSLNNLLDQDNKKRLEEYRIQKINKLVDRKVIRDN